MKVSHGSSDYNQTSHGRDQSLQVSSRVFALPTVKQRIQACGKYNWWEGCEAGSSLLLDLPPSLEALVCY